MSQLPSVKNAVDARHVVQGAGVSGAKHAPDRHHQFAHLPFSGFLLGESTLLHYLGVVRNAFLDHSTHLPGADR